MNSDFRIATDWPEHPKTCALRDLLGPAGPLCLVNLWAWTAVHRFENGDLTGLSDRAIEARALWEGEPEAFVSALRKVGYLDGNALHEWRYHQSYAANAKARQADARKAANSRWNAKRNAESNAESNALKDMPPAMRAGICSDSGSGSGSGSLLNIGSSLRSEPHPPAGGKRGRPAYTEGFLAAWKAYPHEKGRSKRPASFKVWKAQGLEAESKAVLSAIRGLTGGQYQEGFQKWLKDRDFGPDVDVDPDCARCGDKGELNAEGVCDWCVGMDKARAARKAQEARA